MQNNPLSYTDPSGFFLKGLFKAIGNFLRAVGRAFVYAARTIARSMIGRAILQIVACAPSPWALATCTAAAAGLTLAAGGSIKSAFISAALAFTQIMPSGIWDTVGNFVVASGTGLAGTAVTHGIVSGAISVAQGGSFTSGLISGAVSAGTGGLADASGLNNFGDPGTYAGRVAVSAIIGGTASELSGGKFANGAITAAFATMYNDANHGDQASGGAAGVKGGPGTQSASSSPCDYDASYCSGQANPSYVLEESAVFVGLLARGAFLGGQAAVEANIGSKLEFLFGRASGSAENIARSRAMQNELLGIGLRDSPSTRGYVSDILQSALRDPMSVRAVQTSGRVVRESILMGPKGGVKLESTWEGTKLITMKVFSGR